MCADKDVLNGYVIPRSLHASLIPAHGSALTSYTSGSVTEIELLFTDRRVPELLH